MNFKSIIIIPILIVLMIMSCSKSSDHAKGANTLYILHAGSLAVPFKEISEAFKSKYPGVEILLEGHGSRTCARQISELGKRIDVFGSADSAVIRNLLIPEHADFVVDFATNEMVIVFTDHSKYAGEINSNNWYDIFLREGVEFGHSDPNMDPCGYRSVMVMKLAGKYYRRGQLFRELSDKIPQRNIRPKETDLLALLESRELDYVFIYRSVAEQHHLKYVRLPQEINLSSKKMMNFYQSVSVKITGRKPGEYIVKKGAPMVYGITIPNNAQNKDLAIKFLNFILSEEGQKIMIQNGQGLIPPPSDPAKIPEGVEF